MSGTHKETTKLPLPTLIFALNLDCNVTFSAQNMLFVCSNKTQEEMAMAWIVASSQVVRCHFHGTAAPGAVGGVNWRDALPIFCNMMDKIVLRCELPLIPFFDHSTDRFDPLSSSRAFLSFRFPFPCFAYLKFDILS